LKIALPGPLDSAGYLARFDAAGLPRSPATVLVEVKNIRSCVYPGAPEIFQLLHKAVVLQNAQPDAAIVPIFVCRRAHKTTFWMAKQLGFVVIAMDRQFAGNVSEAELLEVRNDLHFNDLFAGSEASARVQDRFRNVLPRIVDATAEQWWGKAADAEMATTIGQLRYARTPSKREQLGANLRDINTRLGGRGGW